MSEPGSWVTTGPALTFGVRATSADIASRGAETGLFAKISEGGRRSAEDDPGDLLANNPEVTARSELSRDAV